MEAAKQALEFAQKQIPVVKLWIANTCHEANEYKGRSSQLHQFVERDLPELLSILGHSIQQLEAYANVAAPNAVTGQSAEIRSATAEEDEAEEDEAEVEDVDVDVETKNADEGADRHSDDETTSEGQS